MKSHVKCPFCLSHQFSLVSRTSFRNHKSPPLTFYDHSGKFHRHDHHIHTCEYQCSNHHTFQIHTRSASVCCGTISAYNKTHLISPLEIIIQNNT